MRATAILLALLVALLAPACQRPGGQPAGPAELSGDAWDGPAIAYSGYRDGQSPKDGALPSQDQVAEDLRLLARHWRLIRVYGSDRHGEDVLKVIRRENLDLDVMLGIWLDREPGHERDNATQIAEGIRLANEYDDIVVAVNVSNEARIEWTDHPVPEARLIRYVREVKASVTQPVTVADNYVWWRDDGAAVAREVDFITIHTYPIWERKTIDEGLSYTIENYESVRAAHPDRVVVIGEAGWATYTEGNQHVPRAGDERKQRRYFDELTAWARERQVTVFWFEAFDEPWKGTGTEGHWGLFTVGREAKPAVQALYPERRPDGPTSPEYPEGIGTSGPDIGAVLHADLAAAMQGGAVEPLGPGLSDAAVVPVDGAGGGRALALTFTGEAWGGAYLFLGGHDASASERLTMRLRVPDEVARLELKLEGPETFAQSVELFDHGGDRGENGWRSFAVPLSAFDEIDLTRVAILGLWNPSDRAGEFVSCEVVVDDIRFE